MSKALWRKKAPARRVDPNPARLDISLPVINRLAQATGELVLLAIVGGDRLTLVASECSLDPRSRLEAKRDNVLRWRLRINYLQMAA